MKINPVLLNWASLLVFMVFGALYSCTSTGSASATPGSRSGKDGTPLGYGYANARSIDVNEVHSIRVLSASQAGLYGSRGANGVIQIKTKQ